MEIQKSHPSIFPRHQPFSLYFKSQYSTALQYESSHERLVQRLLAAQAGIVVYIR